MGADDVKQNINEIYRRRRIAVYALCLKWAAVALRYFQAVQPARPNTQGLFWFNRTAQAAARVFTDAFLDIANETWSSSDTVGWKIAHGIQYGVYLELANDRKNEALRPIIQRFAGRFFNEVKEIYAS